METAVTLKFKKVIKFIKEYMALPYPQSQLSMSQNTVNYVPRTTQPQVSYLNQAPKAVSYVNQAPQYSVIPKTGAVLGTNNYSGGSNTSAATNNNSSAPMEPVPGQPSFDEYDAAIQQGIAALDQYSSTLQPEYDAAITDFTNTATNQKTQARGEEARRIGALEQNKAETAQRGESAIAAARRQAAQLMQGIQSRYGGTTGTGAFSSEILGSQAMQNISGNRQEMENTFGKIYQAEEGVRATTTNLLKEIDDALTFQKEKARTGLQQALAQIASQKAELASSKAQMRIQALQNYQNLVADINARNTQFKQQLYAKAQEQLDNINSFKNQAQQYFNPNYSGFNGAGFLSGTGASSTNGIGSQNGIWTLDSGTDQNQPDWNSIDFNQL